MFNWTFLGEMYVSVCKHYKISLTCIDVGQKRMDKLNIDEGWKTTCKMAQTALLCVAPFTLDWDIAGGKVY